jgi:hypothetical protein
MTDKKEMTKAEILEIIDVGADLARMAAIMSGMSLRAWLETQHDDRHLIDKIIERAALLPPLDEPKTKPPTEAQLRKAGKKGKLRVVIETPDEKTMEAVKRHAATRGIELVDLP